MMPATMHSLCWQISMVGENFDQKIIDDGEVCHPLLSVAGGIIPILIYYIFDYITRPWVRGWTHADNI